MLKRYCNPELIPMLDILEHWCQHSFNPKHDLWCLCDIKQKSNLNSRKRQADLPSWTWLGSSPQEKQAFKKVDFIDPLPTTEDSLVKTFTKTHQDKKSEITSYALLVNKHKIEGCSWVSTLQKTSESFINISPLKKAVSAGLEIGCMNDKLHKTPKSIVLEPWYCT